MPINPVTFYEAVCDKCGTKTRDLGSEFVAWATAGQAADDWTSSDGWVLGDGRVFCGDCLPPELCNGNDFGPHDFDVTDGICGSCGSTREPGSSE